MSQCCLPDQPCVACWDQAIDDETEIPEVVEVSESMLLNRQRARDWQISHPEQASRTKLEWARSNKSRVNKQRRDRRLARR